MTMYKISVNNIWGRIIAVIIGGIPLIFYFGLATLLNWEIRLDKNIIIFWCCCVAFLLIHVRFCCLDWDFYVVKGKSFQFRKLKEIRDIPINSKFEIKTVFLATDYFNVFSIRFDNNEKFYFRYNKYRKPMFSYDDIIKKICGIINDHI